MENLYLIYVNPIGKNSNELYEYEFFFSADPETAWAKDWAEQCPAVCEFMKPEGDFITDIKRLETEVPLFCGQQNACYSYQDIIDKCAAVAFEDISEYEAYPEPFRLVFQFGESFESVKEQLEKREMYFEE